MEDHVIVYRKRSKHLPEYKELAAKSCGSVILIALALVLLRPVMVGQIVSRAEAYSSLGLLVESRRQCDKALLIDSESSQAWCQLARIHKAEGNGEMAYGAYCRAVQADVANRPAHYELGMMYVEDDQPQLAIPHFEQVRAAGPRKSKDGRPEATPYHKLALDVLASCYEKAGEPAKAEFTLEEIRVFYPGQCNADDRLAKLKQRQAKP